MLTYNEIQQETTEISYYKNNQWSYKPFPYDLNPIFEKSREIVNSIFDKKIIKKLEIDKNKMEKKIEDSLIKKAE